MVQKFLQEDNYNFLHLSLRAHQNYNCPWGGGKKSTKDTNGKALSVRPYTLHIFMFSECLFKMK